jgi:hypothetical protein
LAKREWLFSKKHRAPMLAKKLSRTYLSMITTFRIVGFVRHGGNSQNLQRIYGFGFWVLHTDATILSIYTSKMAQITRLKKMQRLTLEMYLA